jgi:hypothetical protein
LNSPDIIPKNRTPLGNSTIILPKNFFFCCG